MREIRVRAWDKHSKKMIYDFDSIPYSLVWFHNQLWLSHFHCNENIPMVMDDIYFELMQYTGLHDKNDKEIWEGDIVRTCRRIGRGYRENDIEIVRYSEITARWYPIDVIVTERCEVIGNIYENPELLRGVK